MSLTSSDMGSATSNASSILLRAPNMILRGMRNPDRFYRVAQMTPQLSPSSLQPAAIERQRSGSWNGPASHGDSTDSSVASSNGSKQIPQKQFEEILAFVNVKSGGGHGKKLIEQLGQIVGRQNVYDLGQPGFDPVQVLRERSYDNVAYRIMACGGDGTSAWLFDSLDKSNLLGQHKVAVIPLGTGNDMGGFLKWGYTFDANQDTQHLLIDVLNGELIKIDRWSLRVIPRPGESESILAYSAFNNYLSVGGDASVALRFHNDRNASFAAASQGRPRRNSESTVESTEKKTGTRRDNISKYVTAYMRELVGSSAVHLYEQISLELDGVSMDARLRYLKPDTLLFLNIKSYAGGCRPWGGPNELSLVSYFEKWKPQRQDDGLLEVIAYTFLEFGDIVLGGRGHRIGQCKTTKLTMKTELPVKVDGEPLMLGPCTVVISRKNQGTGIRKSKKHPEISMLGKLASSCGLGVPNTEETAVL